MRFVSKKKQALANSVYFSFLLISNIFRTQSTAPISMILGTTNESYAMQRVPSMSKVLEIVLASPFSTISAIVSKNFVVANCTDSFSNNSPSF